MYSTIIAVMLVSQKISDFDPAMNISVLFRTKYEGDLKAIARMLGSDASEIIPKLTVGYSVFHLADLGDPFVVAWRPTYSQPSGMFVRTGMNLNKHESTPRPPPRNPILASSHHIL
jgi:hypothetical protein